MLVVFLSNKLWLLKIYIILKFSRLLGDPNDPISVVNDSIANVNSKMILKHDVPVLISIKDIEESEEILYNYTGNTSSKEMPWRKFKVCFISSNLITD